MNKIKLKVLKLFALLLFFVFSANASAKLTCKSIEKFGKISQPTKINFHKLLKIKNIYTLVMVSKATDKLKHCLEKRKKSLMKGDKVSAFFEKVLVGRSAEEKPVSIETIRKDKKVKRYLSSNKNIAIMFGKEFPSVQSKSDEILNIVGGPLPSEITNLKLSKYIYEKYKSERRRSSKFNIFSLIPTSRLEFSDHFNNPVFQRITYEKRSQKYREHSLSKEIKDRYRGKVALGYWGNNIDFEKAGTEIIVKFFEMGELWSLVSEPKASKIIRNLGRGGTQKAPSKFDSYFLLINSVICSRRKSKLGDHLSFCEKYVGEFNARSFDSAAQRLDSLDKEHNAYQLNENKKSIEKARIAANKKEENARKIVKAKELNRQKIVKLNKKIKGFVGYQLGEKTNHDPFNCKAVDKSFIAGEALAQLSQLLSSKQQNSSKRTIAGTCFVEKLKKNQVIDKVFIQIEPKSNTVSLIVGVREYAVKATILDTVAHIANCKKDLNTVKIALEHKYGYGSSNEHSIIINPDGNRFIAGRCSTLPSGVRGYRNKTKLYDIKLFLTYQDNKLSKLAKQNFDDLLESKNKDDAIQQQGDF